MSNSKLVSYTHLTTNHSGKRNHKIDRITPHCIVGQWSAKQAADYFASTNRKSSCNYAIGKTGDVALCVDEGNRSWCSSSASNDHRAVTIECASDTTHPYAMTTAVYKTLVDLCADICRRNGKTKLVWIPNKSQALSYAPKSNEMLLTVHRWFDSRKACPGDWLMARMINLEKDTNKKLSGAQPEKPKPTVKPLPAQNKSTTKEENVNYTVKVTVPALNYRTGPSINAELLGVIRNQGNYTVIKEQNGWGFLKEKAGWINLKYTKK